MNLQPFLNLVEKCIALTTGQKEEIFSQAPFMLAPERATAASALVHAEEEYLKIKKKRVALYERLYKKVKNYKEKEMPKVIKKYEEKSRENEIRKADEMIDDEL